MTKNTTPTRAERRATERSRRRAERRSSAPTATPAWRSPVGLVTIGALLGGALLLAFVVLVQRPGTPSGPAVDLTAPVAPTPVSLADGTTLGRADAPVVMGVWGDFQCPACGSLATNTLPSLIRDFVEPGTLRVEAHDVAILDRGTTESSDSAAGAACAAEQGSYWPYHDWLFANQAGENRGAFRREVLDAIAARIGLDTDAFSSCLDSGRLQAAALAAAGSAGISSTPTLRVGGQEIVGVPAYEQLATLIRQSAGIEAP
ncbi:MAG TPA: thioredoxin domain-containing protein [Candidatus Limnocylindrales bacterium]|nr:thioredoxin domain-containing protein [Candidatus Limnocylindrales bacterium]